MILYFSWHGVVGESLPFEVLCACPVSRPVRYCQLFGPPVFCVGIILTGGATSLVFINGLE